MSYEITIKENGVTIKSQVTETLYNAAGDPVEIPKGNHRVAIGLGDFDGDGIKYRAKIDDLCSSQLGGTFSTLLSNATTKNETYDNLIVGQKATIDMLGASIVEGDDLRAEIFEKNIAIANVIADNDELKRQIKNNADVIPVSPE
tara:strand:- start:23 stop:457 length:435 start_codon:yes stop_codon:yes gene_type:complete